MRAFLGKLALTLLVAGPVYAGGPLILDTDGPSRRFALKDGVASGFFAEVLEAGLAGAGQSVEFHTRPWARCFEEARVGQADGLFAIYRTPERQKTFLFSREPLFAVHEHIFVRSGQIFDRAHWQESLRGKRVGVINGSYHGRLYEAAVAQHLFASVEQVNSADNLASMLAAGRIDAAFSADELMREALDETHHTPAIEMIKPALETLPVYLAFTRKRDMSAVRDAFDRELRKIKQDGRYDAWYQQHRR